MAGDSAAGTGDVDLLKIGTGDDGVSKQIDIFLRDAGMGDEDSVQLEVIPVQSVLRILNQHLFQIPSVLFAYLHSTVFLRMDFDAGFQL